MSDTADLFPEGYGDWTWNELEDFCRTLAARLAEAADAKHLIQQAIDATKRAVDAESRVTALEAALAFYATETNWRRDAIGNPVAYHDAGYIARAALGTDGV